MMLLLEHWLFAAATIMRIKRQVLIAVSARAISTEINTHKFPIQKMWCADGVRVVYILELRSGGRDWEPVVAVLCEFKFYE